MIFPLAAEVFILRFALTEFDRIIKNGSSDSKWVSPLTVTLIVLLVSPGLKVKVPEVAT